MGALAEMIAEDEHETPPPQAIVSATKGSIDVTSDGATINNVVVDAPVNGDWTNVFKLFNLDADLFEVVDDTVRMSTWQQSKGTDDGGRDTIQLWSYSARFKRRSKARLSDAEIEKRRRELRDWVPTVVTQSADTRQPVAAVINLADIQGGKALHDNTPVPTPDGWKRHGDLRIGDSVYGPDGKPRIVEDRTGSTVQQLYRVVFDNGAELLATSEHRWSGTRKYRIGSRKVDGKSIGGHLEDRPLTWTTKQLAEIPTVIGKKSGTRHSLRPFTIPLTQPLEAPAAELPIEPYLLGLWLGDGSADSAYITEGVQDLDWILQFGELVESCTNDSAVVVKVPGLYRSLRLANLLNNKHIPVDYLRGSYEQRLALVQGLMDSDGYCGENGVAEFSNTNRNIADGFAELLSSLGFKYRRIERVGKINGVEKKPYSRITFVTRTDVSAFRIPRKSAAQAGPREGCHQSTSVHVRYVEPAGVGSAQCITVEGGLYLAGRDMIVTHNSEGGGVAATQQRLLDGLVNVQAWLNRMREHHNITELVLVNNGDPMEGCAGNYAAQLFTVELNTRGQMNFVLDIWEKYACQLFPQFDKAQFVSVLCNHGELGRMGSNKNQTSDSDNAGGFLAETLKRVLDSRPEFDHVEWTIPHDQMNVYPTVAGVPMGFCHGHKVSGNDANGFTKWLDGQVRGDLNAHQAKVWVTAHRHNFQSWDLGSCSVFQCPSLDGGSKWFRDSTGKYSNSGILAFLVGEHFQLGWSDMAFL